MEERGRERKGSPPDIGSLGGGGGEGMVLCGDRTKTNIKSTETTWSDFAESHQPRTKSHQLRTIN